MQPSQESREVTEPYVLEDPVEERGEGIWVYRRVLHDLECVCIVPGSNEVAFVEKFMNGANIFSAIGLCY